MLLLFFLFNDTAPPEFDTFRHPLSLHDALPSAFTTPRAGSASFTATGAAAALAGSAAEAILPPGAIAHCAKGMTAQVAASVLNHFFTGKPLVMGLCGRCKEKGKGKSERAVSGTSATSTLLRSRSATGRKAASHRRPEEQPPELQSQIRTSYATYSLKQ